MTAQPTDPTLDTAPESVATAPADKPPWGDDFNAEKAWNLVQNLRADKDKLSKREPLTPEQKQKLAEFDRLAEASKSELERAQEAAQKQSQRAQALLERAVRAEVKATASQGFADPEDAAAFLDLTKYADADGEIDREAIAADLADLLTRKPHLGKQPGTRAPRPDPSQGSTAHGPTAGSPAEEFASILKGQLHQQ